MHSYGSIFRLTSVLTFPTPLYRILWSMWSSQATESGKYLQDFPPVPHEARPYSFAPLKQQMIPYEGPMPSNKCIREMVNPLDRFVTIVAKLLSGRIDVNTHLYSGRESFTLRGQFAEQRNNGELSEISRALCIAMKAVSDNYGSWGRNYSYREQGWVNLYQVLQHLSRHELSLLEKNGPVALVMILCASSVNRYEVRMDYPWRVNEQSLIDQPPYILIRKRSKLSEIRRVHITSLGLVSKDLTPEVIDQISPIVHFCSHYDAKQALTRGLGLPRDSGRSGDSLFLNVPVLDKYYGHMMTDPPAYSYPPGKNVALVIDLKGLLMNDPPADRHDVNLRYDGVLFCRVRIPAEYCVYIIQNDDYRPWKQKTDWMDAQTQGWRNALPTAVIPTHEDMTECLDIKSMTFPDLGRDSTPGWDKSAALIPRIYGEQSECRECQDSEFFPFFFHQRFTLPYLSGPPGLYPSSGTSANTPAEPEVNLRSRQEVEGHQDADLRSRAEVEQQQDAFDFSNMSATPPWREPPQPPPPRETTSHSSEPQGVPEAGPAPEVKAPPVMKAPPEVKAPPPKAPPPVAPAQNETAENALGL